MFKIRVLTPSLVNEEGWRHAQCELLFTRHRFVFHIDLRHWSIGKYEQQWREGMMRVLHGARISALMTRYSGTEGRPHEMWGLWRDEDYVYVHHHSVMNQGVGHPFDPANPYGHLGRRDEKSEYALPFLEWRVNLLEVYASAVNIAGPAPAARFKAEMS